jgi:carboxypeptidase Q
MRGFCPFLLAATCAIPAAAQDSYGYGNDSSSSVNRDSLRALINIDDLLTDGQTLEDFAYATPGRNRVFGSPGHNATVNWLFDELSALNDYYTVTLQPFEALFSDGNASLIVNGVDQGANILTYTPSGTLVNTPVIAVSNFGCNSTDYPSSLDGNIALISRGTCTFGLKSALAGSAGSAGVIIYNNVDGPLAGTLGAVSNPAGPYPPTVGIPLSTGQALLAQLNSTTNSTSLAADLTVNSILENRTTYNVLAQTNSGNPDSVLALGAHSDSVSAGPGINDDGSGIIGNLAVARALAQFPPLAPNQTSVRFGFWSAEEFGLLGSNYYVKNLPAEELAKIKLYLNFDMIASPNYIYALYDGDGSSFNLTGPPGSDAIEAVFQEFFTAEGLNYTATAFDGRSDYQAFINAGVPAGGIFTGAEGIKTAEEAAIFGGTAGVAYDENYHKEGDTFDNLNAEAFRVNTEAIAYSVGTYITSLEGIPERVGNSTNGTVTKRELGSGPGSKKRWEVPRQKRWGAEKGMLGSGSGHGSHEGCGKFRVSS